MTQLDALLETFPCDLCGQRDEQFLYTKRGVLTGHPFRVVRCRSCGLIYLNPRLGDAALAQLYDRNYYHGEGFDPHVDYMADFDKERDAEKVFRPEETVVNIRELVPPPSTLLDFGCGLGDLVRQAAKHGYRAEGYEVSQFAAEFARAKGLRVYTNLDELPRCQYDVVTAVEVLEHCASPRSALNVIHQCLKPGGLLYYTTGNFDGFYAKWWLGIKDSLDGYILPEGHIHFFTTRVLLAYFRALGYSETFAFTPNAYQKDGRWFRFLSRIGLTESADFPSTFWGRLSYHGAREVATVLGLRRKPLPLARK